VQVVLATLDILHEKEENVNTFLLGKCRKINNDFIYFFGGNRYDKSNQLALDKVRKRGRYGKY